MHTESTRGVPLYVSVRERMRRELANMEHGEAIPVESELERRFDVSRITIRRALQDLADEGWLLRQQGRGSFVQTPKLTHQLNLISSWTEQIRQLGFVPKTAQRKIRREKPSEAIADVLKIPRDAAVIRIERLRLADREPISHMVNYLPEQLVPDLLKHKPSDESLYDYLATQYQLVPALATDTVGTRAATPDEERLLRLSRNTPVLTVERLTSLANGTPLEWATVSSRGDRFQYQITVHGRTPATFLGAAR